MTTESRNPSEGENINYKQALKNRFYMEKLDMKYFQEAVEYVEMAMCDEIENQIKELKEQGCFEGVV